MILCRLSILRASLNTADETDSKLLNVLGGEPLHVDEIRNQADLPIERVSATLALMELKGIVRRVGGMNYVAMREEQGNYQAGTQTG
jgi:DNA processing protein